MNPAAKIIEKLGGVSAVAAALEVPHSTVLRWTYDRDKGGTGGIIPTRRQQQILSLGSQKGVPIAPAEFFEAAA